MTDELELEDRSNVVGMPEPTEKTKEAMSDPGWYSACKFVEELGSAILGDSGLVQAVPDPEGFFQRLAGKEGNNGGIFVTIASTSLPGMEASMLVPYEIEALAELRIVMIQMAVKLRAAEDNHVAQSKPQLLVPEKKLIIPGRE